ncbi:hypothetical protein D9M68_982290 [compost metagenome]
MLACSCSIEALSDWICTSAVFTAVSAFCSVSAVVASSTIRFFWRCRSRSALASVSSRSAIWACCERNWALLASTRAIEVSASISASRSPSFTSLPTST